MSGSRWQFDVHPNRITAWREWSWSSSSAIRLRPHRSGQAAFPHPALPGSFGLAPETYGPPCPQAVSAIRSEQSASTYPVSGSNPGQDGDPRVLVLISGTASNAIFRDRFPKHRLTVRPSRFHHPQTLYGSRCRVIIAGRSLSRRGSSGGEPRLGAQQRPRDPGQFAR